MQNQRVRPNMALVLIAFTVLFGIMLVCAHAIQGERPSFFSVSGPGAPEEQNSQGPAADLPQLPAARGPGMPVQTPTPDDPHPLPAVPSEPQSYTIQSGDTLAIIASRFGVSLDELAQANNLTNLDLVELGRVLTIPVPGPKGTGSDFKIIPDSELVYGPASVNFDLAGFVQNQGGYLAGYQQEADGALLSGAQIVERVAQDFAVNPRLLLAVLEYQSGWVTETGLSQNGIDYPLGLPDPNRKGLFSQLKWAANTLSRGFYLWRVNGVPSWILADGSSVPIAPTINAGTAGVQQFFALLFDRQNWDLAVSEQGLFATYNALFGYPFDYALEPLLPADLAQPLLQLPFEPGEVWAFTGGPHGGWGDGSAWAALDFAPPGEALGCVPSNAWVVAVADGPIIRTGNGSVIQDLDGDGFEQTGWTILYMHIESREQVAPGTYLRAGERLGHPSCEGGISTGTHLHLARRYNGEWIPADQSLPFVLDGWVSSGDGFQYNGYLIRDGQTIEAYSGRSAQNGIQR